MNKITFLAVFVLFGQFLIAQVSEKSDIFKTVKELDRQIFDEGFNKCNFASYDSIIVKHLEFYHDKGGITSGRDAFTDSIKNNICGSKNKIKRELVPNSMKVFPLYRDDNYLYGMIEEGEHDFYELNNGTWKQGSRARFTILWLIEDNQFKMSRVLSYDHRMEKTN